MNHLILVPNLQILDCVAQLGTTVKISAYFNLYLSISTHASFLSLLSKAT